MDCLALENDSPSWLSCKDQTISGSVSCSNLPEDLFDIAVIDQNTKIQEFKGSQLGTTIENIEPGTYTINEIKHQVNDNQLGEDNNVFQTCKNAAGFPDGDTLFNGNSNPNASYTICFEYEDEQGNDCSQTTVNDGEDKVCIVKNYIFYGSRE